MATKRKAYAKLQCTVCKTLNYSAHKSKMIKKEVGAKLEVKKFCNSCRKHTVHKESRK